MSNVFAETELMAAAAGNLAAIRSTLGAANKRVAAPTAGVVPAGGDQVSAVIAAMFGVHAQAYQVMGAQAAEFHDKFVQALRTSAGAYANTEASNTSSIQQGLGATPSVSAAPGGAAGPAAHPGNGAPPAAGGSHGDAGGGATPSSNGGGGAGAGGGNADGVSGLSAGNGGGSHVGASFGGTGAVADPGGSGAGVGSSSGAGAAGAAGTHLPNAGWWAGGPGSPGAAGLGHGHTVGASGDSGAIAGMGVPTAPAAPPAAASPAAEPDIALAARAQPVQAAIPALAGHPDNMARPGNVLDTDRDKLPQLIPVPLPRLRGLRKKLQGLRARDEDEVGPRMESGDDAGSRPSSREELLYALGVQVPGHGA
jgi:hypothetical protein